MGSSFLTLPEAMVRGTLDESSDEFPFVCGAFCFAFFSLPFGLLSCYTGQGIRGGIEYYQGSFGCGADEIEKIKNKTDKSLAEEIGIHIR